MMSHVLPRVGLVVGTPSSRIISSSSSRTAVRSFQQGIRNFADNATAAAKTDEVKELTFSSPKIEDLYNRMTALENTQINVVGEILREKLGLIIPDNIQAAGGGAGGGGGAEAEEAPQVEEKTAFDLKLMGFDAKAKIKVIKEVRAIAELGLKEAKALVEGAPKVIKKEMKKEQAEELKKKLEDLGATIELV
mmetsp:Transcript_193/g.281  ORF Transcript_193/g.281 Transcript_193/m.281 type:complete len:192 (-) Transcript_193:141-716(-)